MLAKVESIEVTGS